MAGPWVSEKASVAGQRVGNKQSSHGTPYWSHSKPMTSAVTNDMVQGKPGYLGDFNSMLLSQCTALRQHTPPSTYNRLFISDVKTGWWLNQLNISRCTCLQYSSNNKWVLSWSNQLSSCCSMTLLIMTIHTTISQCYNNKHILPWQK